VCSSDLISSATGEGITQLVRGMADALERVTPPESAEPAEANLHDQAEAGAPPAGKAEAKKAWGAQKS
jgi:hypothetical protein